MALGNLIDQMARIKRKKKVHTVVLSVDLVKEVRKIVGNKKLSELLDNLLELYLEENKKEIYKIKN